MMTKQMIKHGLAEALPDIHCIMTDGDAAIKAAIKIVWPQSIHLLCIWHIITKNASENLKKVVGFENST